MLAASARLPVTICRSSRVDLRLDLFKMVVVLNTIGNARFLGRKISEFDASRETSLHIAKSSVLMLSRSLPAHKAASHRHVSSFDMWWDVSHADSGQALVKQIVNSKKLCYVNNQPWPIIRQGASFDASKLRDSVPSSSIRQNCLYTS